MVSHNTLPSTAEALLDSSLNVLQLLHLSEFYSALYALLMLHDPDPHYPHRSKTQITATITRISRALPPAQQQALQQQRRDIERLIKAGEFQRVRQVIEQAQGQLAIALQKRQAELPAALRELPQGQPLRRSDLPTPDQLPEAVWNALPEELRAQWAAARAAQTAQG